MLTLTALNTATLVPYQNWILGDAEAQKWTGADAETLAYHLEHGHIWLASRDSEPAALLLDSPEGSGGNEWTVTLVVAPQQRGKGLGGEILEAYAQANADKTLIAAIHEDHLSSQKVFSATGFELLLCPNEEGYAIYRRLPSNSIQEDSIQ